MKTVPFFGNFIMPGKTEDDHCVQAVVRMILKYYEPDSDFTWEELDKASGRMPGRITWESDVLLWLIDRGYTVVRYSPFDYAAFAKDGAEYLEHTYKDEAIETITNSDINHASASAQRLLEQAKIVQQPFTIDTIKHFLDKNYLIWAEVDSGSLNNLGMYIPHAVLIKDYSGASFTIHDPGLPHRENRVISHSKFLAAAEPQGYSLTAIKK